MSDAKFQVTFDAGNPHKLAEFWALALDYEIQPPPDGFETWEDFLVAVGVPEDQWGIRSAIVDPNGVGPRVFFQKVPEGKTAKNRVHLDVSVSDNSLSNDARAAQIDDKTKLLVEAGAKFVQRISEFGDTWSVMLDPEGNEFCIS